jgi:hypothetical protein
MTKMITSLLLVTSISFASEYYAKLNPINIYNVKSSVNGKVIYVNNYIESKDANNSTIVKIDSTIDKVDLKQSKIKLENLKEILSIEKGTLKSYRKVSSKSKFDKDNQKIKILNIELTISDLETKVITLKDQIDKKTLIEDNNYIYDIAVEIGDYVNAGVLLYSSMDLSAGKLEIYIPINKANELKTKTIYLDGVKSDLKIAKLYDIADGIHISSYKCEIIVPSPKQFSTLVKIEFK